MQPVIIRLVVLLGIFASVFLVSQVLLGAAWRNREKFAAVNRRLSLIKEGGKREEIIAQLRKNAPQHNPDLPGWLAAIHGSMQRTLFTAAVPLSPQQVMTLMAGLFIAVFALLMTAASFSGFGWQPGIIVLLLAVAVSIGVIIPWSLVSIRGQRRRKRIEQQFPIALDVFVRALRSGHPVASAIDLLTHEMEDPIGTEFGLVADEVSYGAELTDALQAMAERWDNSDMRMFVVSLSVQSETGGNLAEILENLADVIRARASMFMKVRALSSEGRLTAWMLTVLPILSFIGMFFVNPGFYMDTASDPIFIYGFAGLILLYFIGLIWIRRMIDLKV